MGNESIVYGAIVGLCWRTSDQKKLHRANCEALAALSTTDEWPFLTRSMFAVPGDTPVDVTYRSQAIHFGATMKALEYEWHEWLPKFESLLRSLYWDEAHLHLRTELVGIHDYRYKSKSVTALVYDTSPPLPIAEWELEGGPRDFELT